jgi:undecaprenyl-diphosphatase
MPDWLVVILLGIIEGITEFIPISSTGHLLIAGRWLTPQTDLFYIVIQSGAVIAVLPLFSNRIKQFLFAWREPATRDYMAKLLAAFAITCAGGFALDRLGLRLPDKMLPVAAALFVGGVLFIVVEFWLRGKTLSNDITWTIVIAVGLGQLLAAAFPGTSRSGATILLALMLGLSRPAATEFSFLVGIPTMLAAGGLKIFNSIRAPEASAEDWGMVLLGTVVSAIVSFIAVKWLLRYVQTHTFTVFGWYRIVLAIVIMLLQFAGA